ncbi:site-specific integrase [Bacillus cereus group sp. BfR-BA-01347]|uniref:tyrosine-type recombinase/integrase n=1 Tax=Bacillus cereus group sp. BfR-BA-01347 TaxID=2920310 RepID=UPI001F570AE2|nr:site-specific integrase [Bacillus cereus group sp. BfR-BA-01347]
MNWQDTVDAFLSFLLTSGRKNSTVNRYKYDLSLFIAWISERFSEPSQDVFYQFDANALYKFLNKLQKERKSSASNIKRIKGVVINYLQFHGSTADLKSDITPTPLTAKNFASDKEIKKLMKTIQSLEGLSEYQSSGRVHILNRNILLIRFMIQYGLSIQDISTLSMRDLKLTEGIITPGQTSAHKRPITLLKEDQKLIMDYIYDIPESIRPRHQSNDPLFVAFDFAPQTFRWDYSEDAPAALTKIAIQRMLQKEIKRAGIHVTATMLRNRWILNSLQKGMKPLEIQRYLGLKSIEALHRYVVFWRELESKKFGN